MRNTLIVLFVLSPLLGFSQTPYNHNVLNKDLLFSLNTSGGDISGGNGSMSYSIGQLSYLSYDKDNISTTEGVQQSLVITIKPLDLKEENYLKMVAYPNPVSDYFIIEASDYTNRSLKYTLTDLNGTFIKEGSIEEPGAIVDISGLAVAIYLVNVTDNTRHIKTFRIIKK